jgi:hypothetical protein
MKLFEEYVREGQRAFRLSLEEILRHALTRLDQIELNVSALKRLDRFGWAIRVGYARRRRNKPSLIEHVVAHI